MSEGEMQDAHAAETALAAPERAHRLLVCIGAGPLADRLVREGRRLAAALHAEWTVVYVETPALQRLPAAARDEILARLRLAERFGASAVTLSGAGAAAEILAYARLHGITVIVAGLPRRAGWRRWMKPSTAAALLREAGHIDVHLLGPGAGEIGQPARALLARSRSYFGMPRRTGLAQRYPRYVWSAAITSACTAIASLMTPRFEPTNVVMVYLLGVVIVAMRFGRGPSVLASVLSVAAFDFFFVPPHLTFAVSDTEYLVTFAVMLVTGLVISGLAASMRRQARIARYREQRIAALFDLSRELAAARGEAHVIAAGVRHIAEVFRSQVVLLLPDAGGRIRYPGAASIHGSLHGADLATAQWVYDHGQPAGPATDTLPGAEAYYMPVAGTAGCIGALALLPERPRLLLVPEQQRLLETFARQIASGIERARLAEHAQSAELRMETERLRNALLSAISHDLRTPLAAILGASGTVLSAGDRLGPQERHELIRSVHDEAERMSGIVTNVLDMARLQAGAVRLNLQWYPMEEVVGGVLTRMSARLARHAVGVVLPAGLPLVRLDAVLIDRVLSNLLDNAVKYAPEGTPLEIATSTLAHEVIVSVSDRGPGIPEGEQERVFEKFYRIAEEGAQSGAGLGLAICRAIVEAHGGRILARNRPGGGAVFSFTLPLAAPPAVEDEPGTEQAP